jgi:hypothetical protein
VADRLKMTSAFLSRWWGSAVSGPATAILLGASAVTPDGRYDLFGFQDISTSITLLVAAGVSAFVGTAATSRELHQLQQRAQRSAGWEGRAKQAELALIESACDDLRILLEALNLYSVGRASLFLCKGDHFVLLGRYSPMPNFGRSVGRDTYPLDEGILGKAWNLGRAADLELPPAGGINAPPTKQWLQRQARHSISEEVAANFHMRSRSYAGIRLESLDRHRLGVLMVESDLPAADTPSSSVAGGHPGASLDALLAMTDSSVVRNLARGLHHLRDLDEVDLRGRVVGLLPDK